MSIIISDKIQENIYDDAVQPASKSFGEAVKPAGAVLGKAVVSVIKTADALLIGPFHLTVWGIEALKVHFIPKVEARLKKIPEEKRAEPDPLIAGPVLQAVRFATRHEELQDLFANLLATAIDKDTLQNAHPAFVEIIKQLSPDEAKILRFVADKEAIPVVDVDISIPLQTGTLSLLRNFSTLTYDAECEHHAMGPSYINNLCRLEIFTKPPLSMLTATDAYSKIMKTGKFTEDAQTKITKGYVRITDFGRQFINACIVSKN